MTKPDGSIEGASGKREGEDGREAGKADEASFSRLDVAEAERQ